MGNWDNLSLSEKAAMIRVAVKNGITNLQDIKREYNEFAEGGNIYKKGGNKNDYSKSAFLQSLDQSLKEDNRFSSNEFRRFFTELADMESGYRPAVTNSIGAKGYFQLMPSNRSASWSNPTQQFHEMYKLVGNNLDYLNKHLTKKDWERASQLGIDTYGLLAGAHLGGVGNVVKALRGKGNDKDMNSSSVIGYMTKFSQNGPSRPITVGDVSIPMVQDIPEFIPLNSQAFNTTLPTYQRPELTFDESVVQETPESPYSPEEIDRQERMNRLFAFNKILSLTNPYPQEENSFLSTIGLLTGNTFSKGGKIHIKPENRGKFTALKKRTGHSATWFKEHGTPAQKKMATFALNARKWKHGLGGNLFDGTTENSQQMIKPNIFQRPDGSYFYSANDIEIDVTPMNTLGDNPAQWTYTDSSGKIYRPAQSLSPNYTLTESENTNPLVSAANNYFRELDWRAKNDPASIALQGKYTMPLVLSPILGKGAAVALANPYVDAALTSGFGAHGLNHVFNEGINGWGDAAMTALEVAPLGRLFKPAFEMGYSAVKPISDKAITSLQNNYPALFDPYTSWDATLGYHGDNIFSRVLGTVGRRHGFTPKAEVPEFHRRLTINRPSQLKLDEEGNMIISSGRTGEGHDGIVNFATSEPARGHSSHKSLSGIDDYIIDSKAIGNQDFKSIQPSDTFFETGQLAIDPKSMTLVSGNTEMLDYARSLGIRTLSSPRLRQLTASRMTKEDVINSRSEGIAKFLQNVGEIKYGKGQQNAGQIGEEMQRLTSMRGTPTMQDYSYFEGLTGLNSGVRPAEMWNGTKEQGLELFGNWGKPRRTPTFNHVAYAPASNIESIYREAKMGTRPWEDYYAALENMPSARQQLGLNSAMDTYLGEPVIPEGYLTVKPQVRTRVGDVEIDDPNLLYHLDRGNSAGAFSNQGAYIEDGILFPGVAKKEGQLGYSWWNEGKPYATSVKGQPMTRLMTATKDTPGMLQVRSQSYPIGQWTGSKGFVLPSEYVSSEGVNVSGSTYALDPNYGWRRVFAEEVPIADWPVGRTTPQITAENAASITPIPNNSSIRYAGSAKEDYLNSGYGLLDYLRNDKINAFLEGKPFYEMDLGPLGTRKESFPSDWTMTKMPFSDESKEIINNSAKPRILAQAEKEIRDVYDPAIDGPDIEKYVKEELSYIEKQLDEKINEGYELGSEALFKAHDEGKTATRTGGLQLTNNGKIILREGEDPEKFAVHEWEHRRTNGNIGGAHYGNEKKVLRKAFTKEFRELSETVPDFKGMNMDDEMVTTVSDTREALIGKTHLRKTAPDLQNKMIDKSSDEKIFKAVEKANAYGTFYIKRMRELGKLTPELAQNIREALKHVGGYAIPTAIAAGSLYGKQE